MLQNDSSLKQSDPGHFLKARFVTFRRQKYVKKGYMEMTKQFYLKTLKSVLGCSILHFSHHLMDCALKQSTHQFHKIFFSYLKMFSLQCRKNITFEDNKKRMNITNFINIYTNIYTYIKCDKNDSK